MMGLNMGYSDISPSDSAVIKDDHEEPRMGLLAEDESSTA